MFLKLLKEIKTKFLTFLTPNRFFLLTKLFKKTKTRLKNVLFKQWNQKFYAKNYFHIKVTLFILYNLQKYWFVPKTFFCRRNKQTRLKFNSHLIQKSWYWIKKQRFHWFFFLWKSICVNFMKLLRMSQL